MMLEHFYVNKNTDAQGNHEVHRENCDYLPRPENREYLGFFSNSYDAVRAARRKYLTADGCWHCCPESHTR